MPVKTPEMLAVGKRAAARIAKTKKTMAKVQYESLSEGSGTRSTWGRDVLPVAGVLTELVLMGYCYIN